MALPWLAQLALESPLVHSDCSRYLVSTIYSIPAIFYAFYNTSFLLLVNFNLFNIREQETEYSANITSLFKIACPASEFSHDERIRFSVPVHSGHCGDAPGLPLEAAGVRFRACRFPCCTLGAIGWIWGRKSPTRTQLALTHARGCICSLDPSTLVVGTYYLSLLNFIFHVAPAVQVRSFPSLGR